MGQAVTKQPPPAGRGGIAKMLIAPLLVFSFLSAIVVLGLAAWVLDHIITDDFQKGQLSLATISDYQVFEAKPITHYQGLSKFNENDASSYLINFALIAGVVAVASYIVGLHHLRVRTTPSLSTAQGAAWIAFLLLMLPFALVWKEIQLGRRGPGTIALEAFVIILTILHFLYTLLLYASER